MEENLKETGRWLSAEADTNPIKATAKYMAKRFKINLCGCGRFLKGGGAAAIDQNIKELDELDKGWQGRD